MFGGLFVGYLIYHSIHPEVFHKGSEMLNVSLGAFNTVVLLFSSLTMALAISYVQSGKRNAATWMMAITVACALTFMVVKYFEYSHKIHDGLLPGHFFTNPELANVEYASMFFGFYFVMTGLHGVHVVAGAGMIVWVMIKNIRGNVGPEYYTPVEGVGLFWHVVDLVWIYLFPLLYLVG
ncbi:cytochrome c oxidase subunit 3 family protein [Leptospira sp. GIMC2001]|uniref:cytochrome c oxidase subunit 3 family protein n=1 Tax=Leptospira sp. GIMC2001 TaxID=1513297 RepID=UPI003FA5ADA5